MILTYYQAVELMDFLPVLLAPADITTGDAKAGKKDDIADDADTSGIIEMWRMPTTQGIEVNGADFY